MCAARLGAAGVRGNAPALPAGLELRIAYAACAADHSVDAAEIRQAEVHQAEVRKVLTKPFDRFHAAGRLRHEHHVGLAVNNGCDPPLSNG